MRPADSSTVSSPCQGLSFYRGTRWRSFDSIRLATSSTYCANSSTAGRHMSSCSESHRYLTGMYCRKLIAKGSERSV